MSEIDEAILYIGKVVAKEFATKPIEVALETTRMARAELHELERLKEEYCRRLLQDARDARAQGRALEAEEYEQSLKLIPFATRTCRLCQGEPMAPWPPVVGGGPTHHTCHPGEELQTLLMRKSDREVP